MIKLYQSMPLDRLPDASPFCIKLDLFFRLSGIPFEPVYGIENLQKGPKAKIPFIEADGETVCDTGFIIEWSHRTHGDRLNTWLTKEQRAISLAFERMLAEEFYWTLVYHRWMGDENFATVRDTYFAVLPAGGVRDKISGQARHNIEQTLKAHGMGRHSHEEILAIVERTLVALSDYLGDKPYFLGDKPAQVDASVFGFTAALMAPQFPGPIRDKVLGYPNIVAYCDRIAAAYYPARS